MKKVKKLSNPLTRAEMKKVLGKGLNDPETSYPMCTPAQCENYFYTKCDRKASCPPLYPVE